MKFGKRLFAQPIKKIIREKVKKEREIDMEREREREREREKRSNLRVKQYEMAEKKLRKLRLLGKIQSNNKYDTRKSR